MTGNVITSKASSSTGKGSYAAVNGLNLYYESYGRANADAPLILLPGGLGTISMFAPLLPALAQNRQVIAVELQGHGHTADIDRPFRFDMMADDVAALIEYLGLSNADVLGFSLGGGVALQAAIRHPMVIHKLILISTPCKRDGWYPEVLSGQAAMNAEAAKAMVGSPMQEAYANVAPKPENWSVLVDKTGRLLEQDYDWCDDLSKIQAPVLIIAGDADAISPLHPAEMFRRLGGGQKDPGWEGTGMPTSHLAILPATTHYDILFSPLLAPIIVDFLGASAKEGM